MPPNDPGFRIQHGIRGTVITPLVTLFFSCVYKLMLRSQATKTFIVGWFESQPYKWWWLGDGESSCSTNIIFHRSWIDDHPLVWENIHHLLPMASIDIHGTLMLPISSYLHLAANLTTMCPSPAAPLALSAGSMSRAAASCTKEAASVWKLAQSSWSPWNSIWKIWEIEKVELEF